MPSEWIRVRSSSPDPDKKFTTFVGINMLLMFIEKKLKRNIKLVQH